MIDTFNIELCEHDRRIHQLNMALDRLQMFDAMKERAEQAEHRVERLERALHRLEHLVGPDVKPTARPEMDWISRLMARAYERINDGAKKK